MKGTSLPLKEYKSTFDTLYPSLCLFSNKYIDDLETSKDIVQDVFIKVWEEHTQFSNDIAMKSYFYTAVKNRSLNYLKSKQYKVTRSLNEEDIAQMEADSFFFREVVISDTSAIIENALNSLPLKCAQVIRLSIKGMSNAEISQELGVSLNTIKTHKKNAYKLLKPLLKNSFFLIAYIFGMRN